MQIMGLLDKPAKPPRVRKPPVNKNKTAAATATATTLQTSLPEKGNGNVKEVKLKDMLESRMSLEDRLKSKFNTERNGPVLCNSEVSMTMLISSLR